MRRHNWPPTVGPTSDQSTGARLVVLHAEQGMDKRAEMPRHFPVYLQGTVGVANIESCRDNELPGSGDQAVPAVRRNVPVVKGQPGPLVLHPGPLLTARLLTPAVILDDSQLT